MHKKETTQVGEGRTGTSPFKKNNEPDRLGEFAGLSKKAMKTICEAVGGGPTFEAVKTWLDARKETWKKDPSLYLPPKISNELEEFFVKQGWLPDRRNWGLSTAAMNMIIEMTGKTNPAIEDVKAAAADEPGSRVLFKKMRRGGQNREREVVQEIRNLFFTEGIWERESLGLSSDAAALLRKIIGNGLSRKNIQAWVAEGKGPQAIGEIHEFLAKKFPVRKE